MDATINIVFDGPPSHESGRFVEVENEQGQGISIGEWRERPDGYWELVIKRNLEKEIRLLREACGAPTHEENDYNCEDWPPRAGCRGCDGDVLRVIALQETKDI